ncbi:MAG: hypothetical protein WAT39_05345, partial [Planctomycetota bacterium]
CAAVRHFFVGAPERWRTNVPAAQQVTMSGPWPGIDVLFRPLTGGRRGPFEYDVLLAPGADLDRFAVRLDGVDRVWLDGEGRLRARVRAGEADQELIQEAPVAWQETPHGRVAVAVRFRLLGDCTFGLVADDLDPALTTVVDPGVVWATFLGGGLTDRINAMRWREGVGVWVAGWAGSTDFPTTPGAYRTTGGADAFVAKLNDAGTALQFATYLGGTSGDEVRGLDLGPGDTPTVVGFTRSANFPVTPSALQPIYAGGSLFLDIGDAFVTRLSAAGDSLLASTYLGGNYDDVAEAVFVDGTGAPTVTGWTSSSTFPTTPGAVQPVLSGIPAIQSDGFVARLTANGQGLQFSTHLGGQLSDQLFTIDREPASGDWLVAGTTSSFDYPTTPAVVRPTSNGGIDGTVTRLNATGTARVWSTYFGGLDIDGVNTVRVAPNGTVWFGGSTISPNFPTTLNAVQTTLGGQADGFLVQLNANAQSLLYSTLLGGPGADKVRALDVAGTAVVAVGEAGAGFPVTSGAAQGTFAGGNLDAFVCYLTNNGGTLAWSSYFGGADQDVFGCVELANSGLAVVAGWSYSSDFPAVPATLQPTLLGVEDGTVLKLDLVSTFGDVLEISSPALAADVVAAAPGEHELLAATLTNLAPRDLVVDAVRVFVGGAGDAAQRLSALQVFVADGAAASAPVLVGGPLAVPVDNRELQVPLVGCLVPAGSSVQLRVVGTLAADPNGASAEVEVAIAGADAWSLRAVGAAAGPTVRVAGAGRAEGPTFVLGALPGDLDGDGERSVTDVRRLVAAAGQSAGAADCDGDGVFGPRDLAATTRAVLGRVTVLVAPLVLARGSWMTVPAVFPEPRALQVTLGGQVLTPGCATPRELSFLVGADHPVGVQEFVVAAGGTVVLATLVDVQ